MVGEVRLAVFAAVDARRVEVDVVRQPHDDGQVVQLGRRGLGELGQAFAEVRSGHWALVAACHTC